MHRKLKGLATIIFTVSFCLVIFRLFQSLINPEINPLNDLREVKPPQDIIEQIRKLKSQPTQNMFPPNAQSTKIGPYKVPILMYHYIEYVKDSKDTIRQSLNIVPFVFEEQLKTLINANYTFLTVTDLANILKGRSKLPEKPIVLTFDDGYGDFYTDAYPVLKKYNIKATTYVISGVLGKLNYMTASQVKEIAHDGLVEVGAHTVHHMWLKGSNPINVRAEIVQSKKDLELLTGRPVLAFAYPYGAFDSTTISLVKDAGFTSSVSTLPGVVQGQENIFYLFRLRPGGKYGVSLTNWLASETSSNKK